jgi:hypothetical protein
MQTRHDPLPCGMCYRKILTDPNRDPEPSSRTRLLGVSFGSGTIGVGCWARMTGASNSKRTMARINIENRFTTRSLCASDFRS